MRRQRPEAFDVDIPATDVIDRLVGAGVLLDLLSVETCIANRGTRIG
jgi:hypothetical protein